ncbi:hypothetical protein EP10_000789 [Geobacillus icigianus]|uniref:Uncharacterized protein n=1 Tax=Geobacillus icigianus TaxID=1430331 RepID=A0ABU6BDF4_9BACL|nr:hypothetical protein [Geobacillus icigianus]
MKRIPKDVVATFSIVAFDPATGGARHRCSIKIFRCRRRAQRTMRRSIRH